MERRQEGESMKVECTNLFCKYCTGAECTSEEIWIDGSGNYPTCETYEPEEEGKDE